MIEVKGKYTNAYIMIDQVDENCMAQIIQMINHEAFTNIVIIMPDTHSGTGSVIGFTMQVGERLIPNVVGVDISCGMLSFNIGKIEINHKELDDKIREEIPFGINVRKVPILNFTRDFQWNYANCYWTYEWFKDLCKRIDIDPFYVQQSVATLGGGNHFIEFGNSVNTGDTWLTVHSGSRNLGKKICEYWQKRAATRKKLGFGEPKEAVASIKAFSPKGEWDRRIKDLYKKLNLIKPAPLDFLEGDDKNLYIEDMKFAQWYASMNRMYIMTSIIDLIDNKELTSKLFSSDSSVLPTIETVHNYIDFKDNIIRKGAIRSYIGERMIIPFNMRDGILICEGKSNPDWNFSAPHGAGRVYSRSKAKSELSLEKFENDMSGIFSTSVCQGTIDESPDAYKDSKIIEAAIEPTAKILDRIIPIHNMKDIEGKSWKEKRKNVNN
jgi:RNA-splicing ligase RtcB